MIALYIVAGIILLILFVLCVPITFAAEYDEKFSGKIRYLFFTIKIPNDKKEEKEKKHKQSKKKTTDNAPEKKNKTSKNLEIIKKSFKFKGFDGAKKIIKIAAYLVKNISILIKKHLIIKELYIAMRVGSGDAAETSLKYGKLCASVFPALGAVCNTMKVRKYGADISPDFISTENKAYIFVKLQMKPLFIIGMLISTLFNIIIRPIARQKIDEIKDKAVQTNERK